VEETKSFLGQTSTPARAGRRKIRACREKGKIAQSALPDPHPGEPLGGLANLIVSHTPEVFLTDVALLKSIFTSDSGMMKLHLRSRKCKQRAPAKTTWLWPLDSVKSV
jgi:hypothetical protein